MELSAIESRLSALESRVNATAKPEKEKKIKTTRAPNPHSIYMKEQHAVLKLDSRFKDLAHPARFAAINKCANEQWRILHPK